MLERVKKENVAVEHWGNPASGNFRCMIGECTPYYSVRSVPFLPYKLGLNFRVTNLILTLKNLIFTVNIRFLP